MSRSAKESSWLLVPGCAMQVPPAHASANAFTAMVVGPVRVVFALLAKSTWKRHRLSELEPKFRKGAGAPAGGAVAPSRSGGSTPPKLVLSWKHCWAAAVPLSMAVRSYAQSLE